MHASQKHSKRNNNDNLISNTTTAKRNRSGSVINLIDVPMMKYNSTCACCIQYRNILSRNTASRHCCVLGVYTLSFFFTAFHIKCTYFLLVHAYIYIYIYLFNVYSTWNSIGKSVILAGCIASLLSRFFLDYYLYVTKSRISFGNKSKEMWYHKSFSKL